MHLAGWELFRQSCCREWGTNSFFPAISQNAENDFRKLYSHFVVVLRSFSSKFPVGCPWRHFWARHSDTAIVPRISRELQSTRCFVKIKHCIERIKQYKIDDIIVSRALARVCLLFCIVFFPQTGHQGEGRGEGFLNKVFAELLSLKDQALYTLLIYIPLLIKQITGQLMA